MSGQTSMMVELVILWSDKFQVMLLKLFSSLIHLIVLLEMYVCQQKLGPIRVIG